MSKFCNNFNSVIGHGNYDFRECHRGLRNGWTESLSDDEHIKVQVIRELVDIRTGRTQCPVVGPEEIASMLEDLCVN